MLKTKQKYVQGATLFRVLGTNLPILKQLTTSGDVAAFIGKTKKGLQTECR